MSDGIEEIVRRDLHAVAAMPVAAMPVGTVLGRLADNVGHGVNVSTFDRLIGRTPTTSA